MYDGDPTVWMSCGVNVCVFCDAQNPPVPQLSRCDGALLCQIKVGFSFFYRISACAPLLSHEPGAGSCLRAFLLFGEGQVPKTASASQEGLPAGLPASRQPVLSFLSPLVPLWGPHALLQTTCQWVPDYASNLILVGENELTDCCSRERFLSTSCTLFVLCTSKLKHWGSLHAPCNSNKGTFYVDFSFTLIELHASDPAQSKYC